MKIILLLLSVQFSQAAVIKHERTSPQTTEFSFKEFCSEMGVKDAVLISAVSLTELECLNKTFPVIDFCLKKFPMDKKLTRGLVDKEKKLVSCESSESVMLSVSCDKRDLKYCFIPKKGCEELRKIYANRLEVAHYSMLTNNLNCYFSKSIGESLE